MHGVDINLLGVLLSGIASMIIGMLYYADSAYGKEWKRLAKIDEKRFAKEMGKTMPWVFLGALATAYLVALVSCFYEKFYVTGWLKSGLAAAFIIWIAVAVNMAIHNALDQRPVKLTVINLGNRFLSLLAMGLILGWLHS